MWYHGVKLYRRDCPSPSIFFHGVAQNDLTALRPLMPYLRDGELYSVVALSSIRSQISPVALSFTMRFNRPSGMLGFQGDIWRV